MKRELTIVIPALNEEEFIEKTVTEILQSGRDLFAQFEIIMVNDGSSDRTGQIMDELARANPEARVIHHRSPQGVGVAFWEGIDEAKFDNLSLIPGDNAFNVAGLKTLFEAVGSAQLVVSFRKNASHARSPFRIFLSKAFRLFVIVLSGYRLKDFYSAEVYPVGMVRQIKVRPRGYTYQIETLISLLAHGVSYIEVPASLNLRETRNSQVFKWKTVREVLKLYWRLVVHRSDYRS